MFAQNFLVDCVSALRHLVHSIISDCRAFKNKGVSLVPKSREDAGILLRYRRRLIRKRLLWRAFRKRRELTCLQDNHTSIKPADVLLFSTVRNEAVRLPHFLEHYRALGVAHFFFVDNASDDGTTELLQSQPDVTLYQSKASYRQSRFGVDWLNWLKRKYAHGHWVVVADADEILIYPDWQSQPLPSLTAHLEQRGHKMMGALMLDMYPKGPPDAQSYTPGQDPMTCLQWFDAHDYWVQQQRKLGNFWLQGGARARMFFADRPELAPTLNKIPLVHWSRGFAFVNSTHSALPSRLNETSTTPISGALLHTKFLPGVAKRAAEERLRDEHFQVGANYAEYYASLTENPDMWFDGSQQFEGWEQLVDLGLMTAPDWS